MPFTLRLPPYWEHRHLASTDSTMTALRALQPQPAETRGLLLTTDFQTAGHGQRGTHWESAAGRNLLFSLLFAPRGVDARSQFALSEAMALAAVETLDETAEGNFSVKWPNDIYWADKKIGGMLLEHTLSGAKIVGALVGVGLNINQRGFLCDAPNPISLFQIRGEETDRASLLEKLMGRFDENLGQLARGASARLHERYMERLYRREGLHPYCDARGRFYARIEGVAPDGTLSLTDADGRTRRYLFKEVQFLIPTAASTQ